MEIDWNSCRPFTRQREIFNTRDKFKKFILLVNN